MKYIYIILAFAALLLSISYALNQYIRIKEHNLNVIDSIRLCANLNGDQAVKNCADRVKMEYIFDY